MSVLLFQRVHGGHIRVGVVVQSAVGLNRLRLEMPSVCDCAFAGGKGEGCRRGEGDGEDVRGSTRHVIGGGGRMVGFACMHGYTVGLYSMYRLMLLGR